MSKNSIRKVGRQNRRKAAKLARQHGYLALAEKLEPKITAPGRARHTRYGLSLHRSKDGTVARG